MITLLLPVSVIDLFGNYDCVSVDIVSLSGVNIIIGARHLKFVIHLLLIFPLIMTIQALRLDDRNLTRTIISGGPSL